MRSSARVFALTAATVFVTACQYQPHPMARALSTHLEGLAETSDHSTEVGYSIHRLDPATSDVEPLAPESCAALGQPVARACDEAIAETHGCAVESVFGWAGNVPRCAVRTWIWMGESYADELPELWLVDVDGRPQAGRPHCGNGIIEPGELCDDGNTENLDGCDDTCRPASFGGCEHIIYQEFYLDDVADVPADAWQTAGTQLLANPTARPLQPTDDKTCTRAATSARNACSRMRLELDLVDSCSPSITALEESRGCAVRFHVTFARDAPLSDSVFSPNLTALLTFTLK